MYLMISKYLVPLEQVDAVREAHMTYLAGLEAQNLVPAAGRKKAADGGIILLNVDDEDRARELIAADPYVVQGVAEYTAVGWDITRGVLKDY